MTLKRKLLVSFLFLLILPYTATAFEPIFEGRIDYFVWDAYFVFCADLDGDQDSSVYIKP
jgi:hypothetical protein